MEGHVLQVPETNVLHALDDGHVEVAAPVEGARDQTAIGVTVKVIVDHAVNATRRPPTVGDTTNYVTKNITEGVSEGVRGDAVVVRPEARNGRYLTTLTDARGRAVRCAACYAALYGLR